ncbi:DUF1016 N-terminal domain-containing protein [Burkholderia vietnamiensis]|uniref:DUF1016 N-terminal domain-containing protein n=1 Tax=Burkholderia vietnamiensis TaxID=60552 RepID=UPI002011504E|nr:DUF1016 N-terminal domain-containing protein [Burkholderia vietnamiensis]
MLVYWQVGRRIRDDVLRGERAGYGQQILPALARRPTIDYGRGWSEQQLRHCVRAAELFTDEPDLRTAEGIELDPPEDADVRRRSVRCRRSSAGVAGQTRLGVTMGPST